MGKLARFTIFFLCCVLLAALISPWIYLGVKELSRSSGWGWVSVLAKYPFHRFFNRVLQVSIILGVLVVWLRTGMGSMGISSWADVGLVAQKPLKWILMGFISSLIFFGIYQAIFFMTGFQSFRDTITPKGWPWLSIFLGAFVISFIEEIFFRGYFYQLCKRELNRGKALLIQLIFFSSIHYIKPPRAEDLGEIGWSSGFQMLGLAFQRFGQIQDIMGGLLVLMIVAWILCRTFEMMGNLYLPIGLHAGWIVIQQMGSEIFQQRSLPYPQWIFGGGNLAEGVVAILPLLIQFFVLKHYLKRKSLT